MKVTDPTATAIGYSDPSADIDGMDDGAIMMSPRELPSDGPVLVSVPQIAVTGSLKIIVLLVDLRSRMTRSPMSSSWSVIELCGALASSRFEDVGDTT